jgi:uncharacterized membrane protein YphA (DoxX/SURF4 family)
MQLDPVIPVTCSLILSYVFVVASFHKWQNMSEFRQTLSDYRVVPERLLSLFIYSIPALEMITGVALLIPIGSGLAAIFASVLLFVYMFAIGINLLKGRRSIDCGCGGTEQRQNISEWLLLRNGLLLFLAYCVTASVQVRELFWFDWTVVFLAAVVGCLFYNIINQLLVNKDLLKVLRTHG